MKNFTRILVSVSVLLMAFTAYSQDVFKTANVGIGTTTPAQKLEIAGTVNTIRIDGLATGGTYNSATTGTSSNLVYVNNSTGDFYALPTVDNAILSTSASGVPTWSTTAVSGTAWLLSGNAATYTAAASPAIYLGTTSGNGAGFQFAVGGTNAGRVESTNENVALGYQALNSTTSTTGGTGNIAIGYTALKAYTASGGGNIAIGSGSLLNTTTGANDIAIGGNAMNTATTAGSDDVAIGFASQNFGYGSYNTSVGYYSQRNQSSGTTTNSYNSAFGYYAQAAGSSGSYNDNFGAYSGSVPGTESGSYNAGFGSYSLYSNSSGTSNVAAGYYALYSNTTTSDNTAMGYYALKANTATGNSAFGWEAMESNTSGTGSVAVGYQASALGLTSNYNTVVGYQAAYNNTFSGTAGNTVMGYQAYYSNTSGGSQNTAIGYEAMQYYTATANGDIVAIGYGALAGASGAPITNAERDVAVGVNALTASTTGAFNTAVGFAAGHTVTGSDNTALGYDALYQASGSYNNAIGYNALYSNIAGNYNVAEGYNAGYTNTAGNANTSGSYNTFVGANSGPGTSTQLTNASAIGAYATVAESNAVVIGSISGVNSATATANVGIGTNTPNASAALDVESTSKGILIPQLSTAPLSPAKSLLYFNTTTGCFMFYNGTNWQAIVCTCPGTPASPGTITGEATFCNDQAGAVYSVSPTTPNATSYIWTVPSDATITAGQGSTSITVTFGVMAGNITVAGSNNCGTGTASTLAVTQSSTVSITGEPVNATVNCTTTTASFAVTASGTTLTYQWQVSTNSGSTWTNVTNGGYYTNATTATLTVTSPTTAMSGYEYQCVVSSQCSSATSTAATLTVTASATIITAQPTNQTAQTTGTATFTVAATGATGYAWQVSTDNGSTWTALSDGGVYGGSGTASLVITDPTAGMNGYEYECVVTGGCGTVTSSAATLSVCTQQSVPIVITGNGTASSANFEQMLTINFSTYATGDGLNSNLNNVEFTSGPSGGGTPLYAWIENSSVSTTPATAPTSSSTAAVVWVNLGSITVPASGTLTIYMNFEAAPVMTSTTSYTGEAPNITSTYGQYDNGALVFPTFYDNFAGTSLDANWSNYSAEVGSTVPTVTVNNGLTIAAPTIPDIAGDYSVDVMSSVNSYSPNLIAELYADGSSPAPGSMRSYMPGLIGATPTTPVIDDDNEPNGPPYSYMSYSNGRASLAEYAFLQGVAGYQGGNNGADYDKYDGSYGVVPYQVISLVYSPTSNSMDLNYSKVTAATTPAYSPTGSLYFAIGDKTEPDNSSNANSLNAYWARIRVYPPSGTMPSASAGTYACY